MHDKPHTFLTVVDKTSVHRQVLYGVAISVYVYALLSLLRVFIVLSNMRVAQFLY